jgi:hypothetical protein
LEERKVNATETLKVAAALGWRIVFDGMGLHLEGPDDGPPPPWLYDAGKANGAEIIALLKAGERQAPPPPPPGDQAQSAAAEPPPKDDKPKAPLTAEAAFGMAMARGMAANMGKPPPPIMPTRRAPYAGANVRTTAAGNAYGRWPAPLRLRQGRGGMRAAVQDLIKSNTHWGGVVDESRLKGNSKRSPVCRCATPRAN